MVLVVENRKLKGVWWKYGLGLVVAQMVCWIALGYRLVPDYSLAFALANSAYAYMTLNFFAFLPFVFARLGLRRLFWCGLAGFVLGEAVFITLVSYEPTRHMGGNLLPLISFGQANIALISLGVIIEFGSYVYKKVFEE